ncbi:MAG: type II toxin-antitoxin system VapC family toxin [Planctomycetota bacterium]
MTGYLLDTQVLLWWLQAPSKLAPAARAVIGDGENAIYLSSAAAWEMGIKKSLGRLEFPGNLEQVLHEERIEVLSITLPHALAVADLPLLHQDPFDRMQIVQARLDDLVLVTRDPEIRRYDVRVLTA